MTLALLIALFLSLTPADTTDGPMSAPSDPIRQVITRAEIESAGLYRLPDLYRLIDGVRTTTVDGFTWRADLVGGDPFGAETWTLLLDGERVDFALFGEQNLSLLPVAITQVDSVEVWRVPRVVAGTFAHGGVIHIHTNGVEHGVAARGGFGIGNEVGDPGPYRYVPERTSRNVDKFGADYEALASVGSAVVQAQARFKLLRFYATDVASTARNHEALLGENPALRLFAPAIRIEADALGGSHALNLLGGGANDLWFFQPFGRELPVRRRYGQAGLHGAVPVAARAALAYRFAFAENRLDEWGETAFHLGTRWRSRTLRGGLEGRWQNQAFAATLGAEAERTSAEEADGFTLGTVTGTVTRAVPGQQQHLDAALSTAGDGVAASAALGTRHTLGAWTLGATAALTQRLPEQESRLGFWVRQGYDAFANLGVGVDILVPPTTAKDTALSIDAVGPLAPGVTLEVGAGVRSLSGVYREVQPMAPDPDELPRLTPTVFISADGDGTFVNGRAKVLAARGRWRGAVFYDGRAPLNRDGALERAWDVVPRHRAGLDAAVSPDAGFTLSGSLVYRSEARWIEYAALDGGNGGLYSETVPAVWLLDAALEKELWQRRLRLSLLFRNLLNQEERYHPIGAALDLRFYLRLELKLGA